MNIQLLTILKKLLLKLFQFMKLLLLMNQKSDQQGSWEVKETTGEEEGGEEEEVKERKGTNVKQCNYGELKICESESDLCELREV